MASRSPLSWIINHLSYMQIFILICILFFLSIIPIGYYWISTHLERLQMVDEQLVELAEEKVVINLFQQIQNHRDLTQVLFLSKNETVRQEIKISEDKVQNSLDEIIKKYYQVGPESIYTPTIWQIKNLHNVQMRWKSLTDEMTTATTYKGVERIHTNILHDLLIQFAYLSAKVGISYAEVFNEFEIIDAVFLRLPPIQEYLSQLILYSERGLLTEGKDLPNDRINNIIQFLEIEILYLSEVNSDSGFIPNPMQARFLELLRKYQESVQDIIRIVQIHFFSGTKSDISFLDFREKSTAALQNGYHLWDEGLQDLVAIFLSEREHLSFRLWSVLLITIFSTGFAFFLGLVLTLKATRGLSQLTEATDSFTNGNLSVRVPEIYQDEIGRQAHAFNRMAQKLEEIINHLYELLDATSALAQGNLTARIHARENDTEFDQVAQSFNHMAETFETIISRLKQIGEILTSSASEISASSKEQETVIVEQEATTREIAVAANEISSTAKEFANTMNEMSLVAEQTSNLAMTGKGSLNHMEGIMNQLVDASGNIASKLAVLNEKAGNITGVITTITKVADQTNLLSLNASIEAEKAGEYGRSFAVIAREIRRLADQTAVATLDIEKIVNEIMGAVSTSVTGVDDFTQEIRKGVEQVRTVSEQLGKIIEQVQIFTARFELLNQGMQAQSTGAEQINEAIYQLSLTAQHTSAAIHQLHKTIQELNNAANELKILNPFTSSLFTKGELQSSDETTQEKPGHFKETLSNLNIATSKLRKMNAQGLPPSE